MAITILKLKNGTLINNMNYTSITLGELLSSENETIKRNAVSILKVLQKMEECTHEEYYPLTNWRTMGECKKCHKVFDISKAEKSLINR